MKRLSVDITPLRESAGFRRIWIGSTATAFGSQLGAFAAALQVWDQTNNAALLGLIGVIKAAPLIIFAVVGGTASDRISRRAVALISAVGQTASTAILAVVLLLKSDAIVTLFILVLLQSAFTAYGAPARRSFVAMLLPSQQIGAGLALTNISFQLSMLVGPALAGVIAAVWSPPICFVLEALGLSVAFYGLLRLPAEASKPGSRKQNAIVDTLDGFRYLFKRPVLAVAMLSDLNATVFAMPVALFPVINAERFGGDPTTLGLFAPALAVGGLVASAAARLYSSAARPGVVMMASGVTWAAALLSFGLSPALPLALFFLAVAGFADTVAVVTRGTLIQLAVDEQYRGRVSGADYIVGVGGPEIGNARAGLTASITSGSTSIVLGAAASIVGALLLSALGKQARSYQAQEDSN
ncbi:MFS transporter [Curtobacterium flaccumfaciens]|uniref:MFS transporter n=1 Tax=Curtobacterium flaccumfaciens TaxID=2035 RepID=UPI001BDF43A1|nr:MFS transporter [Curtobacterium flaccumfaciens]MBT1672836.1 MFS transporter [Curtobacterium flaccumfaciens pv. flaccumfaciens]